MYSLHVVLEYLCPCHRLNNVVETWFTIKKTVPNLYFYSSWAGQIVLISVFILVVLFSVQRFGTDRVGYSFAPIILLWFLCIGGIGFYNLIKYDVGVLRAFYPKYIVDYFKRNGKDAWISLGGILLCFTGDFTMQKRISQYNYLERRFSIQNIFGTKQVLKPCLPILVISM